MEPSLLLSEGRHPRVRGTSLRADTAHPRQAYCLPLQALSHRCWERLGKSAKRTADLNVFPTGSFVFSENSSPPYPWGMGSKTLSKCLKLDSTEPYVCCVFVFLYIHTYEKN